MYKTSELSKIKVGLTRVKSRKQKLEESIKSGKPKKVIAANRKSYISTVKKVQKLIK
jgi:Pyruvate/2-oxoacid:ferredoxin oxidoreductase gamma subunit